MDKSQQSAFDHQVKEERSTAVVAKWLKDPIRPCNQLLRSTSINNFHSHVVLKSFSAQVGCRILDDAGCIGCSTERRRRRRRSLDSKFFRGDDYHRVSEKKKRALQEKWVR